MTLWSRPNGRTSAEPKGLRLDLGKAMIKRVKWHIDWNWTRTQPEPNWNRTFPIWFQLFDTCLWMRLYPNLTLKTGSKGWSTVWSESNLQNRVQKVQRNDRKRHHFWAEGDNLKTNLDMCWDALKWCFWCLSRQDMTNHSNCSVTQGLIVKGLHVTHLYVDCKVQWNIITHMDGWKNEQINLVHAIVKNMW